jgi:hypothetical protein
MPRKIFTAGEVLAAADVNSFLMDQSVMSFAGTAARGSAIGTATEGMVAYLQDSKTIEAYNSSAWVTVASAGTASYNIVQTLYFTFSGSFVKATYPWLRAVRVKLVGGGGGGGGTPNSVTVNGAGGGGAGGYAEGFITNISGLAGTVTVTVGGAGNGATPTVAGTNGGASSFGTAVAANGGTAQPGLGPANNLNSVGGAGGAATAGDLLITGNIGGAGTYDSLTAVGGFGGSSRFSGNAIQARATAKETGPVGLLYGGGGGGGANFTDAVTGATGGNGAAGIVIVELYA